MANIFDYIAWRGDLSFAKFPFNPVDNIIFSQLSYLPLDAIVPGPETKRKVSIAYAMEKFTELLRNTPGSLKDAPMFKDDPALIAALGSAERYRSCNLSNYVNHINISREVQFSAVTIDIGGRSAFIAYRGTDSTLIGWKEDFNMSFNTAIPSQLEAVSYLEQAAKKIRGSLRIGGHSKGGNLAVYAASFCSDRIRRRIDAVYCNDGPGFHKRVMESKGYQAVRDRLYSYVPQSSVIGMLFEHEDDYMVIKSSQAGIMQHELYSWELVYNDLVHLDQVTKGSRFVDRTLKEWIGSLDREQRRQFTDALFSILSTAEAKSVSEINAGLIIQGLKNTDESARDLIAKSVSSLLKAAKNNIDTLLTKQDNQ
jgi:hypothetical protein